MLIELAYGTADYSISVYQNNNVYGFEIFSSTNHTSCMEGFSCARYAWLAAIRRILTIEEMKSKGIPVPLA